MCLSLDRWLPSSSAPQTKHDGCFGLLFPSAALSSLFSLLLGLFVGGSLVAIFPTVAVAVAAAAAAAAADGAERRFLETTGRGGVGGAAQRRRCWLRRLSLKSVTSIPQTTQVSRCMAAAAEADWSRHAFTCTVRAASSSRDMLNEHTGQPASAAAEAEDALMSMHFAWKQISQSTAVGAAVGRLE